MKDHSENPLGLPKWCRQIQATYDKFAEFPTVTCHISVALQHNYIIDAVQYVRLSVLRLFRRSVDGISHYLPVPESSSSQCLTL